MLNRGYSRYDQYKNEVDSRFDDEHPFTVLFLTMDNTPKTSNPVYQVMEYAVTNDGVRYESAIKKASKSRGKPSISDAQQALLEKLLELDKAYAGSSARWGSGLLREIKTLNQLMMQSVGKDERVRRGAVKMAIAMLGMKRPTDVVFDDIYSLEPARQQKLLETVNLPVDLADDLEEDDTEDEEEPDYVNDDADPAEEGMAFT